MKALLIPLILGLVGVGAGIGAGIMLTPEKDTSQEVAEGDEEHGSDEEHAEKEGESSEDEEDGGSDKAASDSEFARMSNQFIVPIIKDERVVSVVVLSITVEVGPGESTTVFQKEPRLRDSFLRVLFDHANIGGFDAGFTQSGTLEILRKALRETARESLGETLRDILIVDIMRQEV